MSKDAQADLYVFAALMVLVGDMLLGWGVSDTSLSGCGSVFFKIFEEA